MNNYKINLDKAILLRKKFPSKIPVIVNKLDKDLVLEKRKFLVSEDSTFGQFVYIIRNYLKLEPHEAIFCFIGKSNIIPSTSTIMLTCWEKYKENECLYVYITKENTFG